MKKHVSISKACEILGVSENTVLRYEDQGILHPYRTPGGHRRFSIEELEKVYNKNYKDEALLDELILAYCRVSAEGQSDNLDYQERVVVKHKDRLARFGAEIIQVFLKHFEVELIYTEGVSTPDSKE